MCGILAVVYRDSKRGDVEKVDKTKLTANASKQAQVVIHRIL